MLSLPQKEYAMSRPNVLFIMTDHTRQQALAPGGPCLTPNLDRLATEGVRFHRAYTTNAICSPARASLFTGQYPSAHGVWDCTHTQRKEWVDVHRHPAFWSQRLREAGYETAYYGKWHVEQTNDPGRYGWGEHDHGTASARPKAIDGTGLVVPKAGYKDYFVAAVGDESSGPITHPAFDRGIEFIRRAAPGDAPWCCFVSSAEPHDPYVPPKRFFDMYDPASLPLPATLHDELAGKPEILRRMADVWKGMTEDDWRFATAAYYALVTFLDSEVGRILDVLRQTGADENTIIVFTADHGDMLGSHGLFAKGITPYEEVYNIPMLVRVPGMRSGEDAEHLTSLVDLGPTLCDLCGVEGLPDAQGRSLRPVLDGSADPADWSHAYAEFFGQRFVYTQRIVWEGDWKYIFSPGGVDELYDLGSDPAETRNLACDPAHRDRLEAMCKRMWRKMKAIGDTSLFNTHYATLRLAPVGPESIQGE